MTDTTTELREALPLSCKECRKRKARCDRAQPCVNCSRAGNDCVYERIIRTPLTRKHLTQVEDELARARSLLRQYESERALSDTVNASVSNSRKRRAPAFDDGFELRNVADYPSNGVTSPTHAAQTLLNAGRHDHESTNDISITSSNVEPETGIHAITGSAQRHTSRQNPRDGGTHLAQQASHDTAACSGHASAFNIETPPKGVFDWDERFQGTNDQGTDGMATLTESSRGYMGVASGAALLRLADDFGETVSTEEAILNNHNNTRQDARNILTPALFSLSQLEPFVDAYFASYHTCYPIVHEASFRAQFMELIPRPAGDAWKVLLYTIATIGAFAAAETAPETDIALFEAAKSNMSIDMLETGNVTLVQTLALMSNYLQKRNKPNSGYNYLGLAKRLALGIGLHKEFPAWQQNPLMLEIRRRVWYCLYIFDVGAIITFSRPLDLPTHGIEIRLPLNISDGDITASTRSWPPESAHTTPYTHLRCQARFHLSTSSIYERLISSSFPSADEMLNLDDEYLQTWRQELPSYFQQDASQSPKFRLSHSILQWRWRNFRILMYRPYVVRHLMMNRIEESEPSISDAESAAIQRCHEAVTESIRLIINYWQRERQNVLACWYALYFLMQALLIPIICLRNDPSNDAASVHRQQIRDSLLVISSMTHVNSAAGRCHHIILKLCSPFMGDDTAPCVTESPQTQLTALNNFIWPIVDAQLSTGMDGFHDSAAYDFMTNFDAF